MQEVQQHLSPRARSKRCAHHEKSEANLLGQPPFPSDRPARAPFSSARRDKVWNPLVSMRHDLRFARQAMHMSAQSIGSVLRAGGRTVGRSAGRSAVGRGESAGERQGKRLASECPMASHRIFTAPSSTATPLAAPLASSRPFGVSPHRLVALCLTALHPARDPRMTRSKSSAALVPRSIQQRSAARARKGSRSPLVGERNQSPGCLFVLGSTHRSTRFEFPPPTGFPWPAGPSCGSCQRAA